MIHLEERHYKIIKDILQKYPYKFYAFGSRVKGTHWRLSDLDLCIKEDTPSLTLGDIEEEFEESNLPFKVDIVQWKHCSDNFKKLIEKDFELFE